MLTFCDVLHEVKQKTQKKKKNNKILESTQ